jgi:integrase/recombinase XerD
VKVFLEPIDVAKLEEAAVTLRDRLLVRIPFYLGCRVSEALALTVDNIDLSRHTVTIRHLERRVVLSCPSCKTMLSQAHTYCPGCGKKTKAPASKEKAFEKFRTLPLNEGTIKLLKDYLGKAPPDVASGAKPLFGISRFRAYQIVKGCAEVAGMPRLTNPKTGKLHHVSPHRLRDAFAVNAVKSNDSGDGLRMLQEHLGHQSFNTTAKYHKVAGEELKSWYEGLWIKGKPLSSKPVKSHHPHPPNPKQISLPGFLLKTL